ncbi:MAG: molecular chaperone HtpG [Clostridia bacterium]|nr:molecular chaperone HtpG [Clostridia bacterium]
MAKKQFKAESKRLLEMMIHSIYTQKEIFLRELISNASDASDKSYYNALMSGSGLDRERYEIHIAADKEARTLTLSDRGIGMSREELEKNLGTIAESGSLKFKAEQEEKEGVDIIGQFGVGFYSAFMVADEITVVSLKEGEEQAYCWNSKGSDGYTIKEAEKGESGTTIILHIKENTETDSYDEFLEEYHLVELVKKYSDFIKYPITMERTKSRKKEGSEEYEQYTEKETLNSRVPLWKKAKKDLSKEDYENFYRAQRYGYDTPSKVIHNQVEGNLTYTALLYIPSAAPFDFYTKDFKKGLALYSNGVMIMEKCADLLPDYFGFVQGLVDSADLSLNISRELLQQDHQLKAISKNLTKTIRKELLSLLEKDRDEYIKFFEAFGRTLKYGLYSDWGMNRETLQDLILFRSSANEGYTALKEYTDRMPEDQKFIYYGTGESRAKILATPAAEGVLAKGYEILCFTEDVDEFAIKMLGGYAEKEFKNITDADLGFEAEEAPAEEHQELMKKIKEALGEKVSEVKVSARLVSHPACLSSKGAISIEMEKVLSAAPDGGNAKAEKVLEINPNHPLFSQLEQADDSRLATLSEVLFNQALLIEGLPIDDPVAYSNAIWKLLEK